MITKREANTRFGEKLLDYIPMMQKIEAKKLGKAVLLHAIKYKI